MAMAEEKKRVKIEVAGKKYTIVSHKSTTHIELVGETINQQLTDLEEMAGHLTKEERLMLLAINAVSDQIDSHQQMLELDTKVKRIEESNQ